MGCVRDKAAYFAGQIYKATKGLGTDDDTLIRVVVSRCEVDMVQIKEQFQSEYRQPLSQFVAVRLLSCFNYLPLRGRQQWQRDKNNRFTEER